MPVDEAIKAYELIKEANERKKLYVVEGGDDTFSRKEHALEVIEKTLKWINSLGLKVNPKKMNAFT